MGNFAEDTAVGGGDGRYTATMSRDWEIWGPCGGYVASILLRAAGAHARFDRPATISVQFLGVAAFDEVQLTTETLRSGKRSEAVRVSMRQGDRPIAEATAWIASDDADGFEYDWSDCPAAAGAPLDHPRIEDLLPEGADDSPFPFWENFEYRPLGFRSEESWLNDRPFPPVYQAWMKFLPVPRFDDPFVDAGRVLMLADICGWPAVGPAIEESPREWMAPNMDVYVAFHQQPDDSEHLFLDADAPLATGGLVGSRARIWGEGGRLLATSAQQMLIRNMPSRPA